MRANGGRARTRRRAKRNAGEALSCVENDQVLVRGIDPRHAHHRLSGSPAVLSTISFLRWLQVSELEQQQYVVDDLENATDDEWQSAKRRRESAPASAGVTAAAKLRGRDVKLAAAARSAAVTIAMT